MFKGFPDVLGAVGDIAGAAINARSAEKAKDANVAMAAEDRALQREFAQHGVRWRVSDAKAAGIHPLAALGMPATSASPTAIGVQPDTSAGELISRAGQNIGRAVEAQQAERERLQNRLLATQIQGTEIENISRLSDLALRTQAGQPPGYRGTDLFNINPADITSAAKATTGALEAGSPRPGARGMFYRDGTYGEIPTTDEVMEDNIYYKWQDFLHNQLLSSPAARSIGDFFMRWKHDEREKSKRYKRLQKKNLDVLFR